MMYPLPLSQRVSEAHHIVKARVVDGHCYQHPRNGSIYTLYHLEVLAVLKGELVQEIGLIAEGGVLEDKAVVCFPGITLNRDEEYILMLEGDDHRFDDQAYREFRPGIRQCQAYGLTQGLIRYQFGLYSDLFSKLKYGEAAMLEKITALTGEPVRTPEGGSYTPLPDPRPESLSKTNAITGFSPNPTPGGTIVAGDFLSISGSGFGASAGTVFYTNADDGGATFTSSGVASDNISWSATAILNKVARRAGTGPINVNGSLTSGSNLTVPYAHVDINSVFSGFGSTTRQRYYLLNKNGTGGYTFRYNTTFAANTSATAAFERALATWRCNAFVNADIGATTPITTSSQDGVNLVLFDATLSAGVLAQAVSRFNGESGGGCSLANTVWWTDELDMRVYPDPPSPGFPWNFGPGAPAFSSYDFESVMLHELGHFIGLGHVIDAADVMHFGLANGSSLRTISANALTGANLRMAYSSAAQCLVPSTANGPMVLLTSGNCTFPVVWSSFTGETLPQGSNLLRWTTSSELNVSHFEVERSRDGVDFVSIGTVQPQGSSSIAAAYAFTDTHPFVHTFYRIRERDKDGNSSYSNIIELQSTDKTIRFYPNPATQTLTLEWLSGESGNLSLELTDMHGATVLRQEWTTSSGLLETIPVEHLARGLYAYRIRKNGTGLISGTCVLE